MAVTPRMFSCDPAFSPPQMTVRYVVGTQEREAVVLTNGHSFEAHISRLQGYDELRDEPTDLLYLTWPLAAGGAVAIRTDSIVALEART